MWKDCTYQMTVAHQEHQDHLLNTYKEEYAHNTDTDKNTQCYQTLGTKLRNQKPQWNLMYC